MEYADKIISHAEKMQEPSVTPYDEELHDALEMQLKIRMLLGHMQSLISAYHVKHGDVNALADVLMEAQEGFEFSIEDIIRDINRSIENYEPAADERD